MFDDFSALIWRTDALGKVIYVNKEWTNFIGVSRAECLGAQYLDWIHPKDRDSYMAIRKKLTKCCRPLVSSIESSIGVAGIVGSKGSTAPLVKWMESRVIRRWESTSRNVRN